MHNLEDPQLVEFADNARKELFNLRFQHATGQLENTARLKQAKRDLARALTVARQRGIDVETSRSADRRGMAENEENVTEEDAVAEQAEAAPNAEAAEAAGEEARAEEAAAEAPAEEEARGRGARGRGARGRGACR